MTPEKRETAIKWLTEEIHSLRLAPKINGCGPENWADQLEIMETCLEAVRECDQNATEMRPGCNLGEPLTLEQLRGMGGEPVYLKNFNTKFNNGWHILKGITKDEIKFRFEGYMEAVVKTELLGVEFNLYSYPPAHIDREVWVSVYDRLPEPGERVLATDCGFVGEFYINKRGKWQRYNVNCSELLMALDILYWMPLPAPPTKET